MAEGSAPDRLLFAPQLSTLIAVALGAATLVLMVVLSARPELVAIPAALLAAAAVGWAVWYTTSHPQWIICPLVMIEFFAGSFFLTGTPRALFDYGLVALFCIPLLPAVWRNRTFRPGGFGLYSIYFLWAAVTVVYSLSPAFSASRLMRACLAFAAISLAAFQVRNGKDVARIITYLTLGCAVAMAAVMLSMVALPSGLTWVGPGDGGTLSAGSTVISGSLVRFRGFFTGPNNLGELMLVTVGSAAVLWPLTQGRRRMLLAILIATALFAAALADSRTPFVSLAAGAACYLVWKYRARGAVLLLVVVLVGGGFYWRAGADGYIDRGDVSSLTGRTEIWEFVLHDIELRPILGYGYEVAGQIFQSPYFPVWWGPWDEGPHSSLHDGYLDHAVGVGVPATLLWLFIVLRPWWSAMRRNDDPWGLKPIVFWMVIPMLVHNLTEASLGDFLGAIGLSFAMVWAIAERARMVMRARDDTRRQETLAQAPPAIAALLGSLLVGLSVIGFAPVARAQTRTYFGTLAPHAVLPDDTYCAQAVRGDTFEPRPSNYQANHTVPASSELAAFHLAPIKGHFAPVEDFVRVDGQFTGTTDAILRWGACKWGIDENVVRAEAAGESHWYQDHVGDRTHDRALCPPGIGFPGAWDGSGCAQSYGIMQVKFRSFGGWPETKDSTAFNVDFRLAYQRACMNGDIHYLARRVPASGYPVYPNGTTDQMLWGCMGDWYSGSWYDAGALRYIAAVKELLASRAWLKPVF